VQHGQTIGVTNDNKLEYVYLMADFKLNQQARNQTKAFIQGFRSIISANWIKVFSPPELQR
jgi:ubiquitin-protein ligase E3 B